MNDPQILLVYVTCRDSQQARDIASVVIGKKLAACANIFPPHESLYEWNGALENSQEVALLLKTTREQYEDLQSFVIAHHSYDIPCIVAFDAVCGNPPFLKWVTEQMDRGGV